MFRFMIGIRETFAAREDLPGSHVLERRRRNASGICNTRCASGGCIRLPKGTARIFYEIAPFGIPVKVTE
jgi:hypothetical protein